MFYFVSKLQEAFKLFDVLLLAGESDHDRMGVWQW